MIRVERTFDTELVRGILTRADIWEKIAEDGQNIEDLTVECEADCWLLLADDELTIGVYNLHPENGSTLQVHIHILPEYRLDYARPGTFKFFKWFCEECPKKYQKMIAKVPAIHPNVRDFSEEFGLKIEGNITKSYLKDGELVDMWILGISRDEMQGVLSDKNR